MTRSFQLRHTSYTHQHISSSRGQHPSIGSEQPYPVQLESANGESQKKYGHDETQKQFFFTLLASKKGGH